VAWLSRLCDRHPDQPARNAQLPEQLDGAGVDPAMRRLAIPGECYAFWEHHCKGFRRPCRDLPAADVTAKTKATLPGVLAQLLPPRRRRLPIKITGWPRIGFLHAILAHAVGLAVHVVAECADPVSGAHYHGLLTHPAVLRVMARAKVVVVPSSADSSPNVLFEASLLGCNVVASQSCGNWELCHPALLAEPYGVEAFAACMRRAVERRFTDNLGAFLDPEPWERFRERLDAALARG
jgi:glycosyltransferase involved in cell wall biosynthesis